MNKPIKFLLGLSTMLIVGCDDTNYTTDKALQRKIFIECVAVLTKSTYNTMQSCSTNARELARVPKQL